MCDWLPQNSAECFSQEQRSKDYTGDGSYAFFSLGFLAYLHAGPARSFARRAHLEH